MTVKPNLASVDVSQDGTPENQCLSCKLLKGTKDMLSDGRFWIGVFVGAGGFYAYTRYKAKKGS